MEKKILATILSLLWPGLGHFYSRKWTRGIVIFFGSLVIFYLGPRIPEYSLISVIVNWLWHGMPITWPQKGIL